MARRNRLFGRNKDKLNEKLVQQPSQLIGAQAQPVPIDKTVRTDIDINKELVDQLIVAGKEGSLNMQQLDKFTTLSTSREQMYQLIDTMAADPSIAIVVRLLAEDACEPADNGHIIWAESDDPKISKFVNYLLDVMNVDKYIYKWTYCLIKYGDVYLKLYRESDYEDKLFSKDKVNNAFKAHANLNEDFDISKYDASKIEENLQEKVEVNIHKAGDHYSYYVEMMPDPSSFFELTRHGKTYGFVEIPPADNTSTQSYLEAALMNQTANQQTFNYRMKSNDITIYQADDFVHACLDDNFSRVPETVDIFVDPSKDMNDRDYAQSYQVRRGKSLLADQYKVWREKSLLENAVLLNRLTRSSTVKNVQVEVGDMPKSQVSNTLRRVKEMFEQHSAIDTNGNFGEYNNPGPTENVIYTAVHEGKGALTINSTGGDAAVPENSLGDVDWWNTKLYSGFGVPKQFLGHTKDDTGFNGGSSLTVISSVYNKFVKRIQNADIQAITEAINLFLIEKGLIGYLNNFTLKMKTPISQEEKDYREGLTSRISAISNFQSLLTDVEDKPRRLEILKALIKDLDWGEETISVIQKEKEAVEAAQKKEAEQAEAEAAAGMEAGGGEVAAPAKEEAPAEGEADLDLDLGLSSQAPAEESFNSHEGQILTEDTSEDLPTAEELNKDFTQNN